MKRPHRNKIALDCKLPSEPDEGEAYSSVIREAQEIVLEGAPSMMLTLAGVGTIRVRRKPASA